MQLSSVVTALLLPLLAVAQTTAAADAALTTTTMTSSVVLTKTLTLSKVVTTSTLTSTYSANSTSYLPTGTGVSSRPTVVVPTTSADGEPSSTAPPVVPPIDKNAGVQLNAVQVALAGAAGVVVAAFL